MIEATFFLNSDNSSSRASFSTEMIPSDFNPDLCLITIQYQSTMKSFGVEFRVRKTKATNGWFLMGLELVTFTKGPSVS